MNRKSILTTAASLLVGVVIGTGIMMNDQAYESVKEVVSGKATNNNISGVGGITSMDLSGMDIETALMAVQSERAKLLDQQLADQIKEVQDRNTQISKLNNVLGQVSDARGKLAPGTTYTMDVNLASELAAYGISATAGSSYTPEQLDGISQSLRGMIDNQTNSAQMDMLRLQSMTNKRNEAFDVMTNFIKKMQENRASIIGNMR